MCCGLRTPPDFQASEVRVFVRAAPLTVTPALRDWPLTRRGADWCLKCAGALLPKGGAPFDREGPWLESFGRAVVARVEQQTGTSTRDRATVVADSGGVLAIELRRGQRGSRATVLLQAMLEDEIRPLATMIAALLYEAEAYGRVAVDLSLILPSHAVVHEQAREAIPRGLHVARELAIPADEDEVAALARAWHRELQREFGVVKFEREPEA